jgi:PAS domain S-box-containing protein
MTEELLATHEILSLFEKSKSLADQIFDNLSGVFVNLEANGNILRANRNFSNHLHIHHEDALGTNISVLFSPQLWPQFESRLREVAEGRAASVEFELPIATEKGKERSYLWQISPTVAPASMKKFAVYTCIGRDISDVKDALAKAVTFAKDLELAKTMQDLLLPRKHEFITERFCMAATYKAAAIAGGDYWWFDSIDDDKLWIMIGDVTGHGVGPAMVTSMISGCVETLNASRIAGQANIDLPTILTNINHQLCRLHDRPYCMTATAVEIDFKLDVIHIWGAASPPVCLLQKDGEVDFLCEPSGPMGTDGYRLVKAEIPFLPGHRILMMTDGVFEAKNEKNRQFGMRSIKKFMEKSKSQSATATRDELFMQLENWRGEIPADDDITFVVLDRLK